MRIAYFDCFSGISGDMTLGAFLDAGLSFNALSRELGKLKIEGCDIKKKHVMRGEISGTKFDCLPKGQAHHHRSLKDIVSLIDKSALNKRAKDIARNIFNTIGDAERKVHGISSKQDIHLHELGDIDSIVDIVGTAVALDELGIDEVYSSDITLGRTMIDTKAGVLPIPSPASLELLKGIPTRISDIEAELVTPTGAGILKSLSKGFGEMPKMKISSVGYGAGSWDLKERPNMLRVIIGERKESFIEDKIYVVETNIDDMSPQNFEYLFEKLFKEGALDVYTTNIQMKKSRPAFKLTVLVEPSRLEKISSAIFNET
ncbi:MAG: nickel pincer cofactor biosynthesis protein LarC, partial [Candidatus Omnitrophota bacterium]|nr:nickel pincer cofactor biosynthesis protein LarC [Candidatus Omnitrophota bacterium]